MAGGVEFSPELFATICERIAEGESLVKICKNSDMPSYTSVMNWLAADKDGLLVERYARAREAQADYRADETIDIADECTDANIARIRIDARKWHSGKLAPKKYGDKVQNEHSGPDGGGIPVIHTIRRIIVQPKGEVAD